MLTLKSREHHPASRAVAGLASLVATSALGWSGWRLARELRRRIATAERFRLAALCGSDLVYEWDLLSDRLIWHGRELELPPTRAAWREQIHPEDRDQVLAAVERHIQGAAPFEEEYRIARPDGTWAVWYERAAAFEHATGKGRRWIGTVSDVTQRRLADERRRARHRMAAVGRIAGGVAHEVNNMTTVIVGLSDLLSRTLPADHSGHRDLVEIGRAATRVATLTRQLLAYSRQQMLQPAQIELHEVITGLEPLIRRTAGERVDVVFNLAATNSRIFCDRGQLEQALLNLVLNAHEAMPDGGMLSLETDLVDIGGSRYHDDVELAPGRYIRLVVSDTGIGMSAEVRSRAFDPFFTTKPPGEAQGMGLASTYGIVKQSGGYIWVYSEMGQGTAFRIYLPLDEVQSSGSAPLPRPRRGAETILLVEDELILRRMAERVLRGYGYTVRSAGTGEEAIARLSAGEGIQLLLTDAVLPDTTGRELIERARRAAPELPVLGVSGYTAGDVVRRGLLPAAEPFLQKPFTPEELGRAVREALDRAASRATTG
ncbi:MAG TPA: ATP-binding protein [Gemmatimonadales bacterium]|nr:ATP-binding protein [Gemmatimonadales bacterium]